MPAWLAVIVQVPAATRWTVAPFVPLVVQIVVVVDVKLTVRPEDAVAPTVKSAVPSVLLARAPNVMLWLAWVIVAVVAAVVFDV